jgi:hypothetical protein
MSLYPPLRPVASNWFGRAREPAGTNGSTAT